MATNKHAIIRYQALDKCFRNIGRRYFIEDLVNTCNDAIYEYSGVSDGVKKRQVQEDIKFMESEQGWFVNLDRLKDGKRVYYRYLDSSFSINNQPINESEANQLKDALLTLSRFKGLPHYKWIEEIITRLESTFNLVPNTRTVIEFEQNSYLKGREYITEMYYAISYKKVLYVTYKSFKKEKSDKFIFYPYYLKQYNSRWFVFGLNEEYNKIANIALDRIIRIKELSNKYIETDIDFEEYFDDVVGVSIPNKMQIEEIVLEIDNALFPYIETKPIHGSQVILHRREFNTIIRLNLIPNFEFETLIFSYGAGLKVLTPPSLVARMIKKAESMLDKY